VRPGSSASTVVSRPPVGGTRQALGPTGEDSLPIALTCVGRAAKGLLGNLPLCARQAGGDTRMPDSRGAMDPLPGDHDVALPETPTSRRLTCAGWLDHPLAQRRHDSPTEAA